MLKKIELCAKLALFQTTIFSEKAIFFVFRYKLATRKLVMDRSVQQAGFHGMFAYQWGGFTDIDFAVDETGLWVIYR